LAVVDGDIGVWAQHTLLPFQALYGISDPNTEGFLFATFSILSRVSVF
jgi:hypothetical protein